MILRKLCEQKNVEIIEAELCPDHIHMLVSIPPNLAVASFVGYLKGKSALMSKLHEIVKKSVADMTDLEKWAVFFRYASEQQARETVNGYRP